MRSDCLTACDRGIVLERSEFLRHSAGKVHGSPMTKSLSSERFRLRAEELRAIAAEMKQQEIRRFLLSIATDYDRLAHSADFILECGERLAVVSQKLDQQPAAVVLRNGDSGDNGGSADACRVMAADARRLGSCTDGPSSEAWLQLSERWQRLADSLLLGEDTVEPP
jgi:hypothetical protein